MLGLCLRSGPFLGVPGYYRPQLEHSRQGGPRPGPAPTFPPSRPLPLPLLWLPCSRPYKVRSAYPERTYYAGDLDSSLAALGLLGRASLQLDPLPRKAKPKPPAAPAAAPAPKPAPAQPAVFTLQVCATACLSRVPGCRERHARIRM